MRLQVPPLHDASSFRRHGPDRLPFRVQHAQRRRPDRQPHGIQSGQALGATQVRREHGEPQARPVVLEVVSRGPALARGDSDRQVARARGGAEEAVQ